MTANGTRTRKTVKCKSCGATLRTSPSMAGKRIRCPKCRNPVAMPRRTDDEILEWLTPPTEQQAQANPRSKLIECEDCGASVSPRAISCPRCGGPINNDRQDDWLFDLPPEVRDGEPEEESEFVRNIRKSNARRKARQASTSASHRSPLGRPGKTNPNDGTTVLAVALLGLLLPLALPIAWILGHMYVKESELNNYQPGSNGKVGLVIGRLGTVFLIVILPLAFITLTAMMHAASVAPSY